MKFHEISHPSLQILMKSSFETPCSHEKPTLFSSLRHLRLPPPVAPFCYLWCVFCVGLGAGTSLSHALALPCQAHTLWAWMSPWSSPSPATPAPNTRPAGRGATATTSSRFETSTTSTSCHRHRHTLHTSGCQHRRVRPGLAERSSRTEMALRVRGRALRSRHVAQTVISDRHHIY